jgi:Lrp/AsnC family leucine-responsive transcriptional regulator
MGSVLDDTDRKILALLQGDARRTNADIADNVGMTAPSVFERIRKLEQRGVIRGYTVNVDAAALGRPLTAFIRLTLAFDKKHDPGIRAISHDPDVLECYTVAGEDCLIVKTKLADPGQLGGLINRIRRRVTVLRSTTMIALSAWKENGALNVTEAAPPVRANAKNHARRKSLIKIKG